MVSPRAWGVVDPVKNDKRQAANHEDDSHDQEDGCLKRERERETEQEGIQLDELHRRKKGSVEISGRSHSSGPQWIHGESQYSETAAESIVCDCECVSVHLPQSSVGSATAATLPGAGKRQRVGWRWALLLQRRLQLNREENWICHQVTTTETNSQTNHYEEFFKWHVEWQLCFLDFLIIKVHNISF